ncbi:phosphotransferase enzyme family protein [Micromonospora sp. BQ11]|uniref:phosphotransferase enzyme family protein n=1 Tax=Micromonospora sp. BQ11 TaxID=3452212 RepID=UPI003F88BBF6
MTGDEEPLTGNATTGVVRVGDTVRRPVGPWTGSVDAVLEYLWAVGFAGVPRPLGRDEQGRQVVEYVPGEVGAESGTYSMTELFSIGRMLADLHTALAGFVPPPGAVWNRLIPPDREEMICHNDVAPWNLVRSGRGWVLIDWDAAAPGSRLWDLAYAAQSMAGLRADRPVGEPAARLRAFVDAPFGPTSAAIRPAGRCSEQSRSAQFFPYRLPNRSASTTTSMLCPLLSLMRVPSARRRR